jgi:exopolysaccharide biosynthesis polyprenyl glycosylphosphotransferase
MAENTRPAAIRLRPGDLRAIIIMGDLLASSLAVAGALYGWWLYSWYEKLAQGVSPEKIAGRIVFQVPYWFYLLPLIWLILLADISSPTKAANRGRTLRGVAVAAFIGIIIYSLIFIFIKDPGNLPRIGVGAYLIVTAILTILWRLLYIRLFTSPGLMRRVLVLGAGKAGETLLEIYQSVNPPPFRLIGLIDDDPQKIGNTLLGFPILAGSDRLLEIIDREVISDLVIAITGEIRGTTFQTILDAQEQGIEVTRMPLLYQEITGRVPIHHLESDWMVRSFVDDLRISSFYEMGKRAVDLLFGLIGMIILAVISPFVALAIVIDSGLPILYSQTRLGKGGREFTIYKFRTMRQDAESDGQARLASERDPRVTRVGNFLRVTRLDEFPQFINVLSGEMSMVGPRAERPEWVQHFQNEIPFYRARLLVKPGLTGWAQVNYGYAGTVEDTGVKLEYDLYYIKHRSMWMDFRIIFRTIETVLRRKGR